MFKNKYNINMISISKCTLHCILWQNKLSYHYLACLNSTYIASATLFTDLIREAETG